MRSRRWGTRTPSGGWRYDETAAAVWNLVEDLRFRRWVRPGRPVFGPPKGTVQPVVSGALAPVVTLWSTTMELARTTAVVVAAVSYPGRQGLDRARDQSATARVRLGLPWRTPLRINRSSCAGMKTKRSVPSCSVNE